MSSKTLAAMVLLAILTQAVPAAAAIGAYSVDAVISDESVSYRTDIVFTEPVDDLILSITGAPTNVVVEPACRVDKALLQTNIICDSAVSRLTFSYSSTERVSRKGGWLVWSDSFKIPEPATNFSVRVKLPAGAALKEPIADAAEPKGADISSDGRHILITWTANDVSEQWSGSIAYERVEIASVMPTLLAIIAIVAAVGVVAYRYYFSSSKEGMKMILPVLKKDEKGVLEGLIKHGSGVNQKIIVKESGYSKAKVSKVLKSLCERGLVRLERTGRSNRIFWGKEIKKES